MENQTSVREKTDHIQLRTLGGFRLSFGEGVLDDTTGRATQVWSLIAYLILKRGKTNSHDELIGALWPEGKSDDPVNALKNLIYRARTLLTSANIPHARELIQYRGGAYRWNEAWPCEIDAEEMDALTRAADDAGRCDDERIHCGLSALALYQGDFLPFASTDLWVVPLAAYYRSAYFSCAAHTCGLLLAHGQYDEACAVCSQALHLDPFEESVHACYLRALIGKKQPQAALEHYRQMTETFYRELGVRPSEELRALYREITGSVSNVETDLGVIKESLLESSSETGAYICDYEAFRNLYQIKARSAARTGESVFIGLLTIAGQDKAELSAARRNRAMEELLEAIRSTLRRGDVAARFSATQYVLMLPMLTFENGMMVLGRIEKAYQQEYGARRIRITASIQPLDPIL